VLAALAGTMDTAGLLSPTQTFLLSVTHSSLPGDLFLQDPSPVDTTTLSEAPAAPCTTKRPAAIAIPQKSFQIQEAEARPRTPSDSTPFLELQSNTPILSTGPSPKPQASGGRRRKDLVQESMAWNGAFEEEKEGGPAKMCTKLDWLMHSLWNLVHVRSGTTIL
jgi:hypothetical protein